MLDIFGNLIDEEVGERVQKINQDSPLEYAIKVENQSGLTLAPKVKKRGFFLFKFFAVCVFALLIGKLFISQIVEGKVLEKAALGNKIRPRIIAAQRGMITDSNGVWLARNVPSFDLALYPSDLPKDKNQRDKVYTQVSELTGLEKEEIKKKSEENGLLSLDMVVLKENLTREEALLLEEKTSKIPGLTVATRARREYNSNFALSHILGYTGKISDEELKLNPDYHLSSWIGKTGLEASYEKELKGQDGVEQIEVDSTGNIVRVLADDINREPVTGDNISLYLDSGLQQKTYEYLQQGMTDASALTGEASTGAVAIAMDPKTGGILSLVSIPAYDNNEFAQGISSSRYQEIANDPTKPMFDRALSGQYPPGSTIKPVMAVAGLSEGVINENTSFDTPPSIEIGDYVFPDWKDHGITDIKTAIAQSNNIFFYSIGGGFDKIKGLGIEKMKQWWQNFGYGEKTGIDLSGESAGLLPDPEWKKKTMNDSWYLGDTYHAAIGQGDLLVTPIQMVRMVSAVANGGKLLHPTIVKKITDNQGKVISEYANNVENTQVADPGVIKIVQQGMRMTMEPGGSAYSVFGSDFPVEVAGKTGTAQFLNNAKTHAWFECYAPYDNPQIALLVVVEGGGGGHEIAAPIAKNILNYFFTR